MFKHSNKHVINILAFVTIPLQNTIKNAWKMLEKSHAKKIIQYAVNNDTIP